MKAFVGGGTDGTTGVQANLRESTRTMKLTTPKGQPITDWRQWARPKDAEKHWKAGRSAMELARAWFTSPVPVVPPEVARLLATQPDTADAVLEEGWPELKTALPERGEGRNHDLVLRGTAAGQGFLLAIEGKVDETMGPAVGAYWRASKRSGKSFAWRRVDTLLRAVFGAEAVATEAPWAELPYQMLTATVGTAIEAARRDCPVAALVVHEFGTESARAEPLRKNAADFQAFLAAAGYRRAKAGKLYGPLDVADPMGGGRVRVYVGKAEYRWKVG